MTTIWKRLFKPFGFVKNERRLISNAAWIKLIESHEKEYFTKKRIEFLDYVKAEVEKGRTIDDLILELKRKNDHYPLSNSVLKEEDYYVTKNKDFMNYAVNELKNGKLLDELIVETKERKDKTIR